MSDEPKQDLMSVSNIVDSLSVKGEAPLTARRIEQALTNLAIEPTYRSTRFRLYGRKHLPAIRKELMRINPPVANVPDEKG